MTAIDRALIAPWDDTTPELLTATLGHTARATVVLATGDEVDVDVEAGRVSFDESRVPRVEATLTCRLPTDAAAVALLDGRAGARLAVDAGYVHRGGAQDVQQLVDLGLRATKVRRPQDVLELTARSDEAVVLDDSPTNSSTLTGATTVDAILAAIRLTLPGEPVETTGVTAGPAVTVAPLTDKWSTIADLADRVSARVYDDGLRNWFVAPATSTVAAPALALATGPGGTIVEVDDDLTRDDDWFNRVQLTYRWRDTAGNQRQVTAVRSINSGTYAAVAGNIKTLDLTRDVPTTNAEAINAAHSLVTRSVTRGRLVRVTAPAAYWLRPGHTVEVTLPAGDLETHLVTAVEFDLRTGLMSVTTRLPDNTVTATAAGGVLVDDDFERADGSVGIPNIGAAWSAASFLITSGRAEQVETTTTVKLLTAQAGTPDVDVTADLQWVSSPGVGIVFRVVSSTTYLFLTSETAGTNLRLYKVVSGAATQLATSSALATSDGVSFTMRVKALGNSIECFLAGTLVLTYDMTGDAHQATFAAATVVGVRNARSAAGVHHYVERFTAREA